MRYYALDEIFSIANTSYRVVLGNCKKCSFELNSVLCQGHACCKGREDKLRVAFKKEEYD